MTKQHLAAFMVGIFLISVLPVSGRAETQAELQQKINDAQTQKAALQAEQIKLQSQLNALNSQKSTLQGAVNSLDATKKKLANDIKLTQNQISTANLTITTLENSIDTKQAQIEIHQKAISSLIKKLADNDTHSMIGDLLNDEDISAVWTDQGILSDLQGNLRAEIAKLQDAEKVLSKEKELKEKNKLNLVSLQSELGGQKKVVEQTQANKATLLAETKSQEAAFQKLLADNIAREKKFEADLFNYENQLKVTLNPGSIPTASRSTLTWPLAKFKITQQFGKTSSSGRLYASGTHNGVDFGTPVGTPVLAVRGGVIKAQGNTDLARGCYSYGRWILIQHDNGLSTVYGHLSATLVSTGQAVTGGQTIGYSGGMPGGDGAGYSTGPHLHLGLYATQAVSVMQYTTSVNCKGASIPIAPPEGYLDPLAYLPSL
ncbi:MAG: Peptidase, family [Parcubacteria group bacterium]|nr:Peptidase, family [Parcubacteria group bacterium]